MVVVFFIVFVSLQKNDEFIFTFIWCMYSFVHSFIYIHSFTQFWSILDKWNKDRKEAFVFFPSNLSFHYNWKKMLVLVRRLFQTKIICNPVKILKTIVYRNFCYFSFLIFTFNTVKCQSNESTWRNRLHSNEKLCVLFKSPSLEYECFLERYCLKAIRNGDESTKKEILQKAQSTWKSEG